MTIGCFFLLNILIPRRRGHPFVIWPQDHHSEDVAGGNRAHRHLEEIDQLVGNWTKNNVLKTQHLHVTRLVCDLNHTMISPLLLTIAPIAASFSAIVSVSARVICHRLLFVFVSRALYWWEIHSVDGGRMTEVEWTDDVLGEWVKWSKWTNERINADDSGTTSARKKDALLSWSPLVMSCDTKACLLVCLLEIRQG